MITVLPGIRGIGVGTAPAKIRVSMELGIDYFFLIRAPEVPEQNAAVAAELLIHYLPVIVQHVETEPVTATIDAIIDYQRVVYGTEGEQSAIVGVESHIDYLRTVFGPEPQPQAATVSNELHILYEPA